ncbi:hypothetical protein [Cyclobacterium xiamenense]|uniref:hypothetical protein n=1 Tax=Cyclobacterium xiamenense TaxID=1297121 RepID=UPI0035CF1192
MEKKLRGTLLAFVCSASLFTACAKNNEQRQEKLEVSRGTSAGRAEDVAKKTGWYEKSEGDSTWQAQWLDGNLFYESTRVRNKRIHNKFYPKIQDAFLFEDKFYLKASFPLKYGGEIQFDFPEYPDYTLTRIGEQSFQVVINDALDLDRVIFSLDYLPAEEDSLVPTHYRFTHVVFTK